MHNANDYPSSAELDYTSDYLSSPPSSCWHSIEWKFPRVLSYLFSSGVLYVYILGNGTVGAQGSEQKLQDVKE